MKRLMLPALLPVLMMLAAAAQAKAPGGWNEDFGQAVQQLPIFIPVPYNEKDIFFGMLVLKGLVGLHRTIQLQLLQHYWSGHRVGLP